MSSAIGHVLDRRPALAWSVPDGGPVTVTIRDDKGKIVVRFDPGAGASAPWPQDAADLAPGRDYQIELSPRGKAGAPSVSVTSHVAGAEQRARIRTAFAAIDAEIEPDLRRVVKAQVLIHRGFPLDALDRLDPMEGRARALMEKTATWARFAKRGMQ